MLVWILNVFFDLVNWALTLALWVVILYMILKLVMPQNKYVLLAAKYLELALALVRRWLARLPFPFLSGSYDYSPFALCLLLIVTRVLWMILKGILL